MTAALPAGPAAFKLKAEFELSSLPRGAKAWLSVVLELESEQPLLGLLVVLLLLPRVPAAPLLGLLVLLLLLGHVQRRLQPSHQQRRRPDHPRRPRLALFTPLARAAAESHLTSERVDLGGGVPGGRRATERIDGVLRRGWGLLLRLDARRERRELELQLTAASKQAIELQAEMQQDASLTEGALVWAERILEIFIDAIPFNDDNQLASDAVISAEKKLGDQAEQELQAMRLKFQQLMRAESSFEPSPEPEPEPQPSVEMLPKSELEQKIAD